MAFGEGLAGCFRRIDHCDEPGARMLADDAGVQRSHRTRADEGQAQGSRSDADKAPPRREGLESGR